MLPRPALAASLAAAAALLLAGCGSGASTHPATSAAHRESPASSPSSPASSPASSRSSPPASSAASPPPAVPAVAKRRADAAITRRTGYLGAGGVSIDAVDLASGVRFRYGATHGMRCGSIAKLYILETLLLQHQRARSPLPDATRDLTVRMIENSDNDAANDLYVDVGEGPALARAGRALGVRHTEPGPGIYWGFDLSSAADFVALLRNLVTPGGPLDARNRRYALHLLSHVESDQRWGVGAAADPGTTFYNKNGWLPASPDGGRWLVNSVGIVRVHGDRVLMAVLTQHGSSFDGGIDLVDHLARTTGRAVTAR